MNAPSTVKETLSISDLDAMVTLLSAWHKKEVKTLEHMLTIPDGTEVCFGDETPIVLSGDLLTGFQTGIAISLLRLGELPFTVETDDAPVAESDATT